MNFKKINGITAQCPANPSCEQSKGADFLTSVRGCWEIPAGKYPQRDASRGWDAVRRPDGWDTLALLLPHLKASHTGSVHL